MPSEQVRFVQHGRSHLFGFGESPKESKSVGASLISVAAKSLLAKESVSQTCCNTIAFSSSTLPFASIIGCAGSFLGSLKLKGWDSDTDIRKTKPLFLISQNDSIQTNTQSAHLDARALDSVVRLPLRRAPVRPLSSTEDDGENIHGNSIREGIEDEEDSLTTEPFDVMRAVDKKSIRLFCSGCHTGIHRHDSYVIECAGCHRWYHPACHQRYHSGWPAPNDVQMAGEGPDWFHCDKCEKVLKSLVSRAASGFHELPAAIASTAAGSHSTVHSSSSSGNHMNKNSSGGRSWRLVFNQRPGLGGQVALGQVCSVMSRDWGYSLQDIRSFDFAALLKLPTDMIEGPGMEERALTSHADRFATSAVGPVSAALLDVYGADVAELFAITTHPGHRGKGHARALVLDALAPALSAAGVKQLAVCVDEDDEDAMVLWSEFGFEPLQPVDKRRLGWQLPQFSRDATEGSTYFSLDLHKFK